MPGAAIECVEMNWANFIGGGFLLGCGRSSASLRPRHLCFLHIASSPQPTVLMIKRALNVLGLLILLGYPWIASASSEAGLDITFGSVRVRVIYSVALDYEQGEDCIRDPQCLLFDIIALFQSRDLTKINREEILQFDLYQSSKKAGNFLSLVKDPYEGGNYKSLYDVSAEQDLKQQIMSLLERHLKVSSTKTNQPTSIKLYRCVRAKDCKDILFGSFPSEEMHSGYCAAMDNGCDRDFVNVSRRDMTKYFSRIP